MKRVFIKELADDMLRQYGHRKALDLAQQYASDAAMIGDHPTRIRWTRVTAMLIANEARHALAEQR